MIEIAFITERESLEAEILLCPAGAFFKYRFEEWEQQFYGNL